MQLKSLLLCLVMALPLVAPAQFDLGGGETAPPWKSFKLNPKTRIKLDFKNANPDMIVSLLSKTSGVTIVKDPSLKQPLSISSAKPVSLDEAFQIFRTVVGLAGYTLSKDGNILVIKKKPEANAMGMNSAVLQGMSQGGDGGGQNSRSELRVYEVKFASATQVARVVNEVFAAQDASTQNQFGGMFGGGGGRRFQMGGNPGGGGGAAGRRQGPTVKASADDFSNSVIVNAPSREQDQVAELIGKIDKQTAQPQQTRVYKLIYAYATDVVAAVQNVLVSNAPAGRGGATSSNVPFEQRFQQAIRLGGSQASFGTVVADTRTNSLVVTATDENLKIVEAVIQQLDQPVDVQSSVLVIPLQNARADLTAQVLNQAFGGRTTGNTAQNNLGNRNTTNRQGTNNNRPGGGGGGAISGPADPNSLPVSLEDGTALSGPLATNVDVAQGFQFFGGGGGFNRQNQNQQQPARDSQGRIVSAPNLSGQISVIADPTTNSLIVVGSPENAELVRSIADQIDKIPQQVMIETLIVEASLTATDKLGVEWSFTQDRAFGHGNTTGKGGTNFNLGSTGQGFRYTLAGADFSVFLNALKTDQRFQVLSAPRIFTSNNMQAQINISQQVPYVLSQREDTNGNLTFTYAFQDVGIVLTVTPRISANGMVTMDVTQTANDLQGFTSFNAPIINQREADTTVSVKDGETIVLGGIMRTTVNSTVNKVPIIGDIPILGNLFKSTTKTKEKTELLVFLTPRIVKAPEDAQALKKSTTDKLSPPVQKAVKGALDKGAEVKDKTGGSE
jgi:general secretion pathway protein D